MCETTKISTGITEGFWIGWMICSECAVVNTKNTFQVKQHMQVTPLFVLFCFHLNSHCNCVSFTPAIMSSTELIFCSTCWMSPTSVLVCRLRTLFRRMAVNMLQISAWQVTSQCSSSSTMQAMLSASWMMKFISRSNSPPTSWEKKRDWSMDGEKCKGLMYEV